MISQLLKDVIIVREQLWFLLHEGCVFETNGLLCQPHLAMARWISALVAVGLSLLGSGS